MKYKNGNIYTGNWAYDTYQGRGKLMLNNRIVYEGEFSDGEKHGPGVITYPDSSKFSGIWENDLPKTGTLITKNRNKVTGNFMDNEFTGKGTIEFLNGDFYEGFYKRDKPTKQGTLYYKNRLIYEGKNYNF